ncbi:hypothetical protein PHMEG_00010014 [Phytophthora megakarya]|uniref:Uncharacterized protein n=1 Tax=Phytophthora megakarya TaxID=4795 RepID=A0A225WFN5_9STRA|nr:hypothetical protein PHMEG_00010014 [Phytophthora megakarya]
MLISRYFHEFFVSFPVTKDGFNSIMVIVDRLTKRAKCIATKTTDDSSEIPNVFMKNHGMPKTIVSDRDTKFTAKV